MLHHSPEGVSTCRPGESRGRDRWDSARAGVACGHAERFALHHPLDLPGAVDRVGHCDHLVHRSAGNRRDVDILAVDLVEVMAFAHAVRQRASLAGVGDKRLEIGRQFLDRVGSAVAGDDEDLAEVVIEEDRQVVPAGQLVALPRTVDGLGAEDLQARAVDVGEDVEHAVVVADARRPDASAVDVSAFEADRRGRGRAGPCSSRRVPSSPGPWNA